MTDENNSDLAVKVPPANIDRFTERLASAIKTIGGVAETARRLQVAESTVRKWRSGGSEPQRPYLVDIANAADVSIAWLVDGQGSRRDEPYSVQDGSDGYSAKASMAYREVPETLMGRGPLDREALSMALQTVLGAAHRAGYHGYHPDHTDQVADLVVSFYELLEAERPPARRRAMQEKLQTLADGVFRSHKDQG